MNKEIGVVGLGKMGKGIAEQLIKKGWRVIVYNRSQEKVREFEKIGAVPAFSYKELASSFQDKPRVVWVMLPAGEATENAIFGEGGLAENLESGDTIIEAANSFYKDDIRRASQLKQKGINFIDVGVSGGPSGAKNGACLMIGGSIEKFKEFEDLYKEVSLKDGYAHFEGVGAGHFVKMVHNGIEYGMMQAIGEGFNIMKKSDYNLDLEEVARVYNEGSVIESSLIGWLHKAYQDWGVELDPISGKISHSGEGKWTVETAEEMGEDTPVIEKSYQYRLNSQENPNYTGQVVSALRGQFGGHPVKKG